MGKFNKLFTEAQECRMKDIGCSFEEAAEWAEQQPIEFIIDYTDRWKNVDKKEKSCPKISDIYCTIRTIPGLFLTISENISFLEKADQEQFIDFSNKYLLQLLPLVKKMSINDESVTMCHEIIFDTELIYDIYNHKYSDEPDLVPVEYIYHPVKNMNLGLECRQLNNYIQIYIKDDFHNINQSDALLKAKKIALNFIDHENEKLEYWSILNRSR